MAEGKGGLEDLVTVKCRRCRDWLHTPTQARGPGRPRTVTTLPRVAGKVNGWCYCADCLPLAGTEAPPQPDSTHGHRGYRATDERDRRRRGFTLRPDYEQEQAPGQEIGVRTLEDAAD